MSLLEFTNNGCQKLQEVILDDGIKELIGK